MHIPFNSSSRLHVTVRIALFAWVIALIYACTTPAGDEQSRKQNETVAVDAEKSVPTKPTSEPQVSTPPASRVTDPAAESKPQPASSGSTTEKHSAKSPTKKTTGSEPSQPKVPTPTSASTPAPSPTPDPAPAPTQTPAPAKTECGADLPPKDFSRSDVYKGRPFQAGESSSYDISYMGVHAGFGTIDVEAPIKLDGIWHQVFSGNVRTGEWYEKIFIVKDKIRAVSRPWDFGAAQFYIEQDEGTFFGRRFTQKKWINFDHNTCKVFEKTENRKKELKNDEYVLEPGADDAIGALFELRTKNFNQGQIERILVYTSEKNWFLEALPLATETIQVPAGIFNATKLKLTTYLGKELQQKGDVWIWIASDHPNRPLVKVEAEVKVGKIQVVLKKLTPGRP